MESSDNNPDIQIQKNDPNNIANKYTIHDVVLSFISHLLFITKYITNNKLNEFAQKNIFTKKCTILSYRSLFYQYNIYDYSVSLYSTFFNIFITFFINKFIIIAL